MGYTGDDDDDDNDLPEAPPIQLITETFSQVTITSESAKNNKE